MNKNKIIPIKPASTVMVFRENQGQIEVLLLKRNKTLMFAPGFWVFPGGRIDHDELANSSSERHAALMAAVRECLEESQIILDIESLHPYYHWTTPAGGNRRFGTWFFHTLVPYEKSGVIIDNSEIVDHQWLGAEEALNFHKRGQLRLLPPTFISLQRVRSLNDYGEIRNEFARTGMLQVAPVVNFREGTFYSLYRGDAGFETGDDRIEGPRHRLVADSVSGTYSFEFENCLDEIPVTGGVEII